MSRPMLVAEISSNHLGSRERALELVEVAAEVGADAVKFQTWTAGTMVQNQSIMAPSPWQDLTLRRLYEAAFTPPEWLPGLFERARDLGLIAFSAAFDSESVAYLEGLSVPMHKVASPEITDIPLIRAMACTGKPLVISTGGATLKEVGSAIVAAVATGCHDLTVLHCVSAYPTPPERANLRRMLTFREEFRCKVGLSDHSTGTAVAVAAVALGACMVEKHLTLSRRAGGLDAGFSLEPDEFAQMACDCRDASLAVAHDAVTTHDASLHRSLWVVSDIETGGELVLNQNVRTARPAGGMPCETSLWKYRAAHPLRAGDPLRPEDVCHYP
jgi:pseudaminic acid synthase